LEFWDQNYENKGFWRHFEYFGHFVKFQNPKLVFLDKITYYQQIRIKKCFLKKPLTGVSVEFLFRKNLPDAILIFGRNFGFFQKWRVFFVEIILQNGIIFFDFCQIFENKKSKIRYLGLCRHFERFSKTLFYKMLVLLSTTKRERDFWKICIFEFLRLKNLMRK
jgi:hypothetical protein